MQFVSITFLIFFVLLLLSLNLCRTERQRRIVLLMASWLFYAWWDWRFPVLLLIQVLTAWTTGRALMEIKENGRKKKAVLSAGIIICLSMLIICKYFNFFIESFCLAFGIESPGTLNVILPVGISFYTLQSLSYMIDIYRGKVTGTLPLWLVALYIGFFPQIMSGPIVKAHDFLPQLEQEHKLKWKNIEEGGQIFLFGLVKKFVIADTLAVCVDAVYAAPAAYSWMSILIAVCAYSFQIYGDFSGYSDMAIGVAKALGYDLGRNFNAPYLAANPSEFWQRWHISLSSWFKEYVYFPLGGSRKGHVRTLINLLIVMLLSGLWHGAAWTYIMWGVLHGICSAIHRLYRDYRRDHRAGRGTPPPIFSSRTNTTWDYYRC